MWLSEILSRINWVDILILLLLFRISYVGFIRGLGSEIIPFLGILVALIISLHYYSKWGKFITSHTPIPIAFSELLSFLGLVFVIKYIFHLIESLIAGKIVTINIASLYDNIGGLIIGAIRGILLVSLVLIALDIAPFDYIDYSINKKSLMGRKFLSIGRFVHKKATAFFRIK